MFKSNARVCEDACSVGSPEEGDCTYAPSFPRSHARARRRGGFVDGCVHEAAAAIVRRQSRPPPDCTVPARGWPHHDMSDRGRGRFRFQRRARPAQGDGVAGSAASRGRWRGSGPDARADYKRIVRELEAGERDPAQELSAKSLEEALDRANKFSMPHPRISCEVGPACHLPAAPPRSNAAFSVTPRSSARCWAHFPRRWTPGRTIWATSSASLSSPSLRGTRCDHAGLAPHTREVGPFS